MFICYPKLLCVGTNKLCDPQFATHSRLACELTFSLSWYGGDPELNSLFCLPWYGSSALQGWLWARDQVSAAPLFTCSHVICPHARFNCLVWVLCTVSLLGCKRSNFISSKCFTNLVSQSPLLFFIIFSHYSCFTAMYIGKNSHCVAQIYLCTHYVSV
jgi:hypothetical protein